MINVTSLHVHNNVTIQFICLYQPPAHVTIDHTLEVRKYENTNNYKNITSQQKKVTIQFPLLIIVGISLQYNIVLLEEWL